MTSEVSAKESEIKAPSQSDHAANLKRISNKENLLQQIDTMSRNIDTKRQNIAKMSTTSLSLKERSGEFNLSTEMADSRTAYAISLYAKISNISWDYKSASGHLTGCKWVCHHTTDSSCFHLSAATSDDYYRVVVAFCCSCSAIGDDTKKELSKFDLDTRSLSSFDLANRLWALIGQQHSAADDH